MNAKVDFYILTDDSPLARSQLVCRLTEKAYQQKQRVYIHAPTKQAAEQINQLLWTYRDDTFIPHDLEGNDLQPPAPVQIGFQRVPDYRGDILINLSDAVPTFYPQFSRLFEIIGNDAAEQQAARDRYRFYRDNNCELSTHKL